MTEISAESLAHLGQEVIDYAVKKLHAEKQRVYKIRAVNQSRIQITAEWDDNKFTNNIDLTPADLTLFNQFTKKELKHVMPRYLYQNTFNYYPDLFEHMQVQYPDVDTDSLVLLYLTAFNQFRSILAYVYPYAATVLPNEHPNPEDDLVNKEQLENLRDQVLRRDLPLISLYPDRAIKNAFYVVTQMKNASNDRLKAYLLYAINYDVVYDEIERKHAKYLK